MLNILNKNIAFRVDASSRIGTGHFMRCLTLADALKMRGANTRFVSRHLPEYFINKLIGKKHEFVLLDTVENSPTSDELTHASWLGVSQAQDAADFIKAISGEDWDWLVVDHYALDRRWESILRQRVCNILAIDDIADRWHDCNMLLDQNLYANMAIRYDGKVPSNCQLLLGPSYALLRDEFRIIREKTKPRGVPVNRVLVFFGGIDVDNDTGRVIEVLSQMHIPEINVDVVIGAQHPLRKHIENKCNLHKFNCHVQTDKMAELMAAADLAIGAGGSASWERCCLGLPALLLASADNQIDIAKELDFFGACIYVGESKSVTASIIRRSIDLLLNDKLQAMRLSRNAYSLVDGLGVDRVCQRMRG